MNMASGLGVHETVKAPRFRLLILGKAGAGKTSLINQAFGVNLRVEHEHAGKHDIKKEIISPNNDMFILHDSEGFERLNTPNYSVVREFIEERHRQPKLEDQLHAIWLCTSLVSQSIFERADEEVLTRHKHLPVVMVFTKFDEFKNRIRLDIIRGNRAAGDEVDPLVEKEVNAKLKKICLDPLGEITGTDTYPRAVVSVFAPHGELVQKLIQITQELLKKNFGPLQNNSAALAGSIAQRVNPDDKIESSIKLIIEDGSGWHNGKAPLEPRLKQVHKDLIEIWNFKDGHLLSEDGCLSNLRSCLSGAESGETHDIMASSGLQMTARQKTIVLELMTYVMDLTMLLRMIFYKTRTAQGMVPLSEALINQVLEAYIEGPKNSIRTAIKNYVDKLDDSSEFSSEDAAREIRKLIQGNRFDFEVHITTSQTGMPPESTPPAPTSTETAAPLDPFTRTAGDDPDKRISTLTFETKPSRIMSWLSRGSPKSTTVEILQTHQKFVKVENKWAAVLGFRLEIKKFKPKNFRLTGNLQRLSVGKLEIANVWPSRPSGDYSRPPDIQHGASTTVTMAGGVSGFLLSPSLNLGISSGKTDTWTETHAVIRTHFENVDPRIKFEMNFSPLPKKKGVPDALSFAVLVAFPARPTAFNLELRISCGDVSDRCTFECDGATEIKKSVELIPQNV